MGITAERLRRVLEEAIERLEDFEDEAQIETVSNTYFLGDCRYFLGVSGYDGGYVNLDDLREEE